MFTKAFKKTINQFVADEWFYYALLSIRKKLKKKGTLTGGICNELNVYHDQNPHPVFIDGTDLLHFVREGSKDWASYSGNAAFPVPSTLSFLDEVKIFYSLEPRWEGEYGELRKDLLNHLIKKSRARVYKNRRMSK